MALTPGREKLADGVGCGADRLAIPFTVRFTVVDAADARAAVVMNAVVRAVAATPTKPALPILLIVCGDVWCPAVREMNMQLQTIVGTGQERSATHLY